NFCYQPNLYQAAIARVYVCGVGPGSSVCPGSTAPTTHRPKCSFGALRRSRRLSCTSRRLCCERADICLLANLYQAAMRGCMLAGSDRGRTAPALSVRQPQRPWPVWGATAKPPVFPLFPGGFADVEGGVVMVRANWSRIASRNRMRRQGVEDR